MMVMGLRRVVQAGVRVIRRQIRGRRDRGVYARLPSEIINIECVGGQLTVIAGAGTPTTEARLPKQLREKQTTDTLAAAKCSMTSHTHVMSHDSHMTLMPPTSV